MPYFIRLNKKVQSEEMEDEGRENERERKQGIACVWKQQNWESRNMGLRPTTRGVILDLGFLILALLTF